MFYIILTLNTFDREYKEVYSGRTIDTTISGFFSSHEIEIYDRNWYQLFY